MSFTSISHTFLQHFGLGLSLIINKVSIYYILWTNRHRTKELPKDAAKPIISFLKKLIKLKFQFHITDFGPDLSTC